jgi:hypothetical protein
MSSCSSGRVAAELTAGYQPPDGSEIAWLAGFVRAWPSEDAKAGLADDCPSEKALLTWRRLGDLNPGWA